MKDIRGSGFLFITKDRRILILKRSKDSSFPDTWCLPGGKVDPDDYGLHDSFEESMLKAARREAWEEIKIKLSYLTGSLHPQHIDTAKNSFMFRTFIFFLSIKDINIIENNISLDHEHQDWKWIKIDEAGKAKDIHPGLKNTLNILKLYKI